MVFSSLLFLCAFLPCTLLFYFLSKNSGYRNGVLIFASLIFYAWGEPVWILLMMGTTLFDYVNALVAERYRSSWRGKAAVLLSVLGNLAVLGFFKYAGFIVENVNAMAGTHWLVLNTHLPIGISFYTFQSLSYVIDVYRGDVEAQRSPAKLLLFVSLFHQLVAGPIVRYKEIAAEIEHRTITFSLFTQGVERFIIGLGKKVIIANSAGEACRALLSTDYAQLSTAGAWLGMTLFAIQIYFDFSGYSDMAIGLGKMFGFTYLENFNYPYTATSAADFWRRWHMSLGSFFRDYVYVPLGGNRHRHLRNILIVWFLTGLWHGASWNFVIWGLFFGMLIALEKAFLLKVLARMPTIMSHVYLLTAVLLGWVFFYHTTLSQAAQFLRVMVGLGGTSLTDSAVTIQFMNVRTLLIAAAIGSTPLAARLGRWLKERAESFFATSFVIQDVLQPSVHIAILVVALLFLVGQSYNPFLYFRF